MARDFIKITFQDIEIAEEFFENDKHLQEFLTNVIRYYRGQKTNFRYKIVKKYFVTYKKTMDYIINASKAGKIGGNKRVENQEVTDSTLEGSVEGVLEESLEGNIKDKRITIKDKDKEVYKEGFDYFLDDSFNEVWKEFISIKKKKKASVTPRALKTQLKKLKDWCGDDVKKASDVIENSCNGGWSDLYEPKQGNAKMKKEKYAISLKTAKFEDLEDGL